MQAWPIEYHRGGIFLPSLGLWLDPHEPKTGKVFVSHAHSDHIEAHQEVILSAVTAKLMQARLPGERIEHILPYGQLREFQGKQIPYELKLLPAGHIFGSAMSWIRAEGGTLLYTGDFKLRQGLSAEPCEPCQADVLIMETTYGRPQYHFPPSAEVISGVIRFCREALDNDETAVLLGYSLGKSQELLCGLGDAGLPIMLHGTVFRLTQIYEQFGQCFPKYEKYQAGQARGKVLLCPPNVINSTMLKNVGKTRIAVITGWAVDQNCRYRYGADAAFPLSDHADFPELLEFVERVQPKRVYTLHGFAADFAQTLRERGVEAFALSEQEQLPLALEGAVTRRKLVKRTAAKPIVAASPENKAALFLTFAHTCSAIASNPGKLEKVRILSEYLRLVPRSSLSRVTTWFTGAPFASSEGKVMQTGWAVLRDAICAAAAIEHPEFHHVYLKHSDLGETAGEILGRRDEVPPSLTIQTMEEAFNKLHAARGPIAKLPTLIEALNLCTPLEAKYFVKILTSDLRIGLKEGLVEDAIARAFEVPAEAVRQANLLLGNAGQTAELAARNELASATIIPFRPMKFMLASPEETSRDIWERISERHAQEGQTTDLCLWIEDKYDGIRCQLHKVGNRVELYSRDLKSITATFHDVAGSAERLADDVILDGELLAMRGDTVLPFSELQKRLGRREHDLFMREEVPVKFVAFDLLWLGGEGMLNAPLRRRREKLENLGPLPPLLTLAFIAKAGSPAEIEHAFDQARGRNNEGLIIKDPESLYCPGRRGLAWLKLKKPLATLDCVVVGAEYGHGKRNKVLSDYTFAVRDDDTGQLRTIGKAYSGLTDKEISQLTEHFLRTSLRQHGRYFEVQPEIVLEIAFDRLQESARHNSGLAMRFPRIVRIRTDKSIHEIDTLERARDILQRQAKPS